MEFVARNPEEPPPPTPTHPLLQGWVEHAELRKISLRKPSTKAFCGHAKSTSGFVRTLFVDFKSRAFTNVLPIFFFLIAYTTTVAVLYKESIIIYQSQLDFQLYAVTTTLSFLLVFRLSRAAVRWWDSRSYWGVIIAKSRDLASRVIALPKSNPDTVIALLKEIYLFAIAVRAFLRSSPLTYDDLKGVVDPSRVNELNQSKHIFLSVVISLRKLLHKVHAEAAAQANTGTADALLLERHLQIVDKLNGVAGGMERIKNSPLPLVYTTHLRTFLVIYFLWLPWTLLQEFGYYTILVCGVSSFVFLGVEGAASDVDCGPFLPTHPNHVDVDALCIAIQRDMTLCMEEFISIQNQRVVTRTSNQNQTII